MAIESTFVETPYGKFHVEATGSGKPVLFIHGGTASAREWRAVLEPLGKHARCVAMDRLGCGESDRSARGYDRETLTNSLLACADALGFPRFGVVGQSFGGFWSLSLAFAAPERISRMVLVNSGGGPLTDAEIEARRARPTPARPRTDEEFDAVVDRTIREIFADPSRVPASYRDDLCWQLSVADPAMASRSGEMFVGMARENYDRIKIPTLVVFGEADAMIPLERGRRLAAAIPGARFVGIPGAGHTCQIETPDAFVAAVAPFLDETAS